MSNENEYLKSALNTLHSKDNDFIVIGLTGRTGSGCTTTANILASNKSEIDHNLSPKTDVINNVDRKNLILQNYFDKNWTPFKHLRVSAILTLMLLNDHTDSEIKAFLRQLPYIRTDDIDFLLVQKSNMTSQTQDTDFFISYLSELTGDIRNKIEEASFIKLYQLLGKNARRSGKVICPQLESGKFFTLSHRINETISTIHSENNDKNISTYIVIDAFRNSLEASFFQERYASFYLLAVSCHENIRQKRLKDNKKLSQDSINSIDTNEYSSVNMGSSKIFTDQDIRGCLEKADIYVDSSSTYSSKDPLVESNAIEDQQRLTNQIIKFVCLARKPGLITPSPEERCMQVAYTSKLNSGCISRQVGAVVTNPSYSVKSVGWNDAPYGQVPCNLRSVDKLLNSEDNIAYSPFEMTNVKFRNKISSLAIKNITDIGYNPSYCFKSHYNELEGEKNQVHTRSLHAEENAFLQISKDGGSGVNNGYLFTTASPCELCAKKAYQLGMAKIFYIDPYPGISTEHILNAGLSKTQPELVLFNGVVGRAFHNLYTPISAYKDELNALLSN